MKTFSKKNFIDDHNANQIDYYNNTFKKSMRPAESKYIASQIEQFVTFGNIKIQESILEIGCGMGKYTFNLLKKNYKITALDLSPYLISQFERYNNNRYPIKLYTCDILDSYNIITEKFDDIIGFMVLHHIHNLPLSFQAMRKLLKPGGRLIFLEPNAWNPLYYLQIAFTPGMRWKSEKQVTKMREKIIKAASALAGFNNIEIKKFGFFPPFIKNTKWGDRVEKLISKIKFLDPIRPFQIIVISD